MSEDKKTKIVFDEKSPFTSYFTKSYSYDLRESRVYDVIKPQLEELEASSAKEWIKEAKSEEDANAAPLSNPSQGTVLTGGISTAQKGTIVPAPNAGVMTIK